MDRAQKLIFGTCGWSYEEWEGRFYPDSLPTAHRLAFYSGRFDAVEVDSTFYHPPSTHAAHHWAEVTPREFLFCPKLSREITHERKLRDCGGQMGEFLRGLESLEGKLGCVLVQLPPYFRLRNDEHALRQFVRGLPAHVRWAIEFRDPSWHVPRVIQLLENHGVSWVWSDLTDRDHQQEAAFEFLPRTTDFLYLRLLGDAGAWSVAGRPGAKMAGVAAVPRKTGIGNWVLRLEHALPGVARAFVFAGNQFEGHAPDTLRSLAQCMHLELPDRPEAAAASGHFPTSAQLDLL